MKTLLSKLLACGLLAAFLSMATAMVLPHSHETETAHHACWICQSKAIGIAAPETGPQPPVFHRISLAAPAVEQILELQADLPFSEARAPPFFSPVLS